MRHLMIDLETLDTQPKSVILSIGAVIFTRTKLINEYYGVTEVFPQIMKDRTISKDTVEFWKKQSVEAQDLGQGGLITDELSYFLDFVKTSGGNLNDLKVWGKGPHFDVSIIESLLRDFNMEPPWKFWNVRDVRTFIDYNKTKKLQMQGTAHNALADAIYQAKLIQSGLKKGQ